MKGRNHFCRVPFRKCNPTRETDLTPRRSIKVLNGEGTRGVQRRVYSAVFSPEEVSGV